MVQILGFLSLTWEKQTEFWAPSFGLGQLRFLEVTWEVDERTEVTGLFSPL